MGISRIEIYNFRSIKRCILSIKNINLLIGENGTGKTNILRAISAFYKLLLKDDDQLSSFDYNNKFSNSYKIALTFDFYHLKGISKFNIRKNPYSEYKSYFDWIDERDAKETLILCKIKNKPCRWNRNMEYRKNIFNLFPLYVVDSRQINLTDWSDLWQDIGDIVKVHKSKESSMKNEFKKVIDNKLYRLKETFNDLDKAFKNSNIKIARFTPKQYASIMAMLVCNGNIFEYNENKLNRLSNGTNAFNYTNMLIEILKIIAKVKVKEPFVILDEPEISLHHGLIDELCDRIFDCNKILKFMIATHSARLLKNVLKQEKGECQVFHTSKCNKYTYTTVLNLFSSNPNDNRPRYFITDQHANAYFSKYVLSVEGETEMELFSNKFLINAFPILKQIDIVQGMSDDVQQRCISPRKRNYSTKILNIIDMDKVISYIPDKNKFIINNTAAGKYFKDKSQNYFYTQRRNSQYASKRRILSMASKCRFSYNLPFYSLNDNNYVEFIKEIKKYMLFFNIFVIKTTIEGALISNENINLFWEYFKYKNSNKENSKMLKNISNQYNLLDEIDATNFLRILHKGKSDFLFNSEKIIKINKNQKTMSDKSIYILKNCLIKKTSGWVTDWLNYFFCKSLKLNVKSDNVFDQYKEKISDFDTLKYIKKEFAENFYELNNIINIIESQIKNR